MAKCLLALSLTILLGAAPIAGQGDKATADQLSAKIQQRYDTIRDFEADFVQTYEGGVLRTKTTERGTLAIKKPGRMRWLYSGKERKEFVSDGAKIYSYLPADKQVIVSPMPAADQTTPALFLAGRGNIVRDFTATLAELPGAAAGPRRVEARSQENRPGAGLAHRRRRSWNLSDSPPRRHRSPGRTFDLQFQ